jgi:hypothetical protein
MPEFVPFHIFVGNGVLEIYIGPDGKLHIRWVFPDPPPDIISELNAVAEIVDQAALINDRAIAEKFHGFAEEVLNRRREVIAGYMAQASKAVAENRAR